MKQFVPEIGGYKNFKLCDSWGIGTTGKNSEDKVLQDVGGHAVWLKYKQI